MSKEPDPIEVLQNFNNQCGHYLNSLVPDFRHAFVAGGFFPRLFHHLPIRDVDVYVDGDEMFIQFVREYKNMSGFSLLKESPRHFRFQESSSKIMIDLIGFHSPKSTSYLQAFDFTICRGYYHKNRFGTFGASDFDDIKNKKLRFTGKSMYATNDNNVLCRLRKYLDLGFKIEDNELTSLYQYLTGPDAKKWTIEGYAK